MPTAIPMNTHRSNSSECQRCSSALRWATRHFLCGYLLVLAALLSAQALAQAPVEVGARETGKSLTGFAEVWHDARGTSGLEDARRAYLAGEFAPLQGAGSTGLQPGAFWSRFALENTSDSPLTLYLEYVDHQLIGLEAFARSGEGSDFLPVADLSLAEPFARRAIVHNRFVFAVTVPARQTTELLVKFSSDEMGFVFPSLRIWDPQSFQNAHILETGAIAFLIGGFLLMSIFALVCGIATSGKIFYIYSAYALLKIAAWSTILGYTHQYLITDNFHWSYMSITGAAAILCGVIFARKFLQTRRHIPRLDYLLQFMMANAGFLLVCALFKLKALSIISITIALFLYPVISVVALVRWRQGSREAAVFGLAWSLLVFGLVVQALRDLGHVEHNFFNYYWPPVASFIEMLAIMAAMGIRVQRLRLLKEQAEHKYTQHLERSKVELERLVQARTKELQEAKTLAELEARTDALTGIHNRRSFFGESENRLKLAMRKNLPLSLLMFDIDHFKSINDNHGHAIGDDALRAFSDAINGHTRESDVFGRIGGEEFALLLLEEPRGVLDTAQRLRNDVAQLAIETPGGQLQFTASVGIAHWRGETDIEELLHNADRALYLAKRQGRNQIVEYAPTAAVEVLE